MSSRKRKACPPLTPPPSLESRLLGTLMFLSIPCSVNRRRVRGGGVRLPLASPCSPELQVPGPLLLGCAWKQGKQSPAPVTPQPYVRLPGTHVTSVGSSCCGKTGLFPHVLCTLDPSAWPGCGSSQDSVHWHRRTEQCETLTCPTSRHVCGSGVKQHSCQMALWEISGMREYTGPPPTAALSPWYGL